MFQQYRLINSKYSLVEKSARDDNTNQDILNGVYDNSETPLSKEERLRMIFSDWQDGDVLVIADSTLKYPKKQGNTLVEMTREEVCESGDLSVLEQGEVYQGGKITKKEVPDDMIKPEWIYPEWVEKATPEEIKSYYYDLINNYKADILENGYTYIHTDKTSHQQKCREKDLALLGNAIAAQEDMKAFGSGEGLKVSWSFNDGDVIQMSENELKKLRIDGSIFVQYLFNVEAQLKASEPNIQLTLIMVQDMIDKVSDVKCFR